MYNLHVLSAAGIEHALAATAPKSKLNSYYTLTFDEWCENNMIQDECAVDVNHLDSTWTDFKEPFHIGIRRNLQDNWRARNVILEVLYK